jgi:hypothetical protein
MIEHNQTRLLELRASLKTHLALIDLSFKNNGLQITHLSVTMPVYSVTRSVSLCQVGTSSSANRDST